MTPTCRAMPTLDLRRLKMHSQNINSGAVAQEKTADSKPPRPPVYRALVAIIPEPPLHIFGSLCEYHRSVLRPAPPHYIRLDPPRRCVRCGRSIDWAEPETCDWASGFLDLMTTLAKESESHR